MSKVSTPKPAPREPLPLAPVPMPGPSQVPHVSPTGVIASTHDHGLHLPFPKRHGR